MDPKWHFNSRRPCDRMRDSANEAFFTAESLENLSEALIREGIQNSLDAATRGPLNVREVTVKISLIPSPSPDALKPIFSLFQPVQNHFEKGLSSNLFSKLTEGRVGWLVFEDFGTKGLTGDVSEWRIDQSESNAFFSFFRAEGRSSKSGENLGRWGIGKQVFPTASQMHAMFGLSVRAESPARVLMGSAVIRSHSVSGQDYQPDAWFGCFWHGCPKHANQPKNNSEFWFKKLLANRARDLLVTRTLRKMGWKVLRIWEHDLSRTKERYLVRRINKALRQAVQLKADRRWTNN